MGGELEGVLRRVLQESVHISPAGRTDTGVHARGQVVSLATESKMSAFDLTKALNALLGADVWVRSVAEVGSDFDARRSARTRRYGYAIWNAPERSLWNRRWMAHVEERLDEEVMHTACQALVGRHDLAAFRTHRTQDPPGKGTVRTLFSAGWQRDPLDARILRFEIEADAFLRHMVRAIVGSAILIGSGKLPASELGAMLDRRERAAAGPTAPAHGLTLLEVTY